MTTKYVNKCSPFLSSRKLKIKTALKFHLTPVRMAIIRETNKKCWQECEEKGTIVHCWWEHKLISSLRKSVFRDLRKLKVELPYFPATSPKECKSA
jgi:hypothetical protein